MSPTPRLLTLCALLTLAACNRATADHDGHTDAASLAIKALTVDEVEQLLATPKPPAVYDANGEKTREKFGTIPGARLLPSASKYDPAAELPANKGEKVVFYCGSESCKGAQGAAKVAVEAGWKDVNVMPAGIKGWAAAGKKTTKS